LVKTENLRGIWDSTEAFCLICLFVGPPNGHLLEMMLSRYSDNSVAAVGLVYLRLTGGEE